jgi:hypothetical protein
MEDLMRDMLIDEIMSLPDEKRKAFCESPDFAELRTSLQEKGMINKTTLMRLSKDSDLERRSQLAAIALAKADNSPEYRKYEKAQRMKKEAREAMFKRYHSKATMTSKQAQREYIKKTGGISNIILR